MLCTGENCERKQNCGLYYLNPQPEYRKYDNLESFAYHGWGSLSAEGSEVHYDCGPCGDYKMFEPVGDDILLDQIVDKFNALGCTSFQITTEQMQLMINRLAEEV